MQSYLDKISALPTPSPVLKRIVSVVANVESSASDIVSALKLDPAIVGRILKLANSAYIGMPRTISSLQNAVVLLGVKRIHSLVMATEMINPLRLGSECPFTIHDYWRHSITVAFAAESIAKHLRRYDEIDPEEVFSAGLLHDIGKLVLGGLKAEMTAQLYDQSLRENVAVHKKESGEFTHTRSGALLSEHWNFPLELREAIEFHHEPSRDCEQYRLVSIVHIADYMAHVLGYSLKQGEPNPELNDEALASVQLPLERLRVIAENALIDEQRIEAIIDLF